MVGLDSVADRPLVVPELSLSDSLGCMPCNITTEALSRVVMVLRTTSVAPWWSLALVVLLCTTFRGSLVVPQWCFGLCVVRYTITVVPWWSLALAVMLHTT